MNNFLFKDRDGQTPLPPELRKGLIPKSIQNMGELDEYEEDNISEGLVWLEKNKKDCLEYSFWITLHKKLFSKVWRWAGEIRNHDLDNPDFLDPHKIRPALKQLEGDIAFWIDKKTYSEKEIMAHFHERLLTIHPFPNGNGRWSRILTECVSEKVGFSIPTWGNALRNNPKERRTHYIDAAESARRVKNFNLLIQFMYS